MRQGRTARGRHPNAAGSPAIAPLFALVGLLILAAALLGGASRENTWRLASVEVLALPLGVIVVSRSVRGELPATAVGPLVILAAILLVPLLQLVPLPPTVWSILPGQAPRLQALAVAGLTAPWLPVSLSPHDTAAAALALIPPAAMFCGALFITPGLTRRLVWLWIGLAAAGLVLGLVQIATPAGGPAYLYRTTNLGSPVGLFANRNHEAAFLLAMLPFAAVLAAKGGRERNRRGARGESPERGLGPGLAGLFILISVIALGVIRSRAGLILAGPTVVASVGLLWRETRERSAWRAAAALGAVAVVATVAVALFGLSPILERFRPQPVAELRFEAWPYVAEAARAHLPLGAGLGAFDRVFEAVQPLNLVGPTYFNHAHNDYLELWLETGWVGVGLMAVFLVWFTLAAARAWRTGSGMARAASVAILALLAAATVDYALRTETILVLFAFCCGVMANGEAAHR